MLGWPWCGSYKKRDGTRYAGLVLLHPLRSTGYVVCSGSSEACCGELVFFALGVFYVSHTAFGCILVVKCRCTSFYAQLGPVWILEKAF
jgi:hypothetical protein